MTEEIHMDEFFFFTYDSILKKLSREDEGYTELEGEVDKLVEKYPLIKKLREGNMINDGATQTEVEAVQKYMELKFDLQTYIEREHYYRGYRDCILFLIHCGALGTNFEIG